MNKILVGSFIPFVFLAMAACSTQFNTDDDAEDAVDDQADMTTDAAGEDVSDAAGDEARDATGEDMQDEEIVIPPNCGDGDVDEDEGEECDDGRNGDDDDGCTDACRYTCHNNAECSDDEPCNGVEKCSGEHTCEDGDPEDDGHVVDPGPPRIICLDEESRESECGDGFIDTGAGEFCDPPGMDGCDDDCTRACEGDGDCPDDENPCNGEEFCNMDAHKCEQRNPMEEGEKCDDGPRRICRGGNCQESTCGDSYLDEGGEEECDDGKNGDQDDGCTDECEFSCHGDGDCSDGNFCNGAETCGEPSDAGRACREGEWPGTGTECNDGIWCTSDDRCNDEGECVGPAETCNDGFDCTTDECNEEAHECSNSVDEGYCLIGGRCRFHDSDNPGNDCQHCDTYANRADWTNKGSGAACAQDESFCNGEEICNGDGGCINPGNPCGDGQVCWEDGERCCTVDDYLGCDEATGDLYWYDSCDRRGERERDCYDNPPTQNGTCDAGSTPPVCRCRTHWTGEFCHICPGHWDPARDCNFCIANYDPGTDCTTCLPGWIGDDCTRKIRYVDWAISGGDGLTWGTAFNNVQTALNAYPDEIWVKKGTYTITGQLDLRKDYALYGGFLGTETDLNDRNWRANETIISGNDTVPHVFWCVGSMGCVSGTRVDGFTITGGYDDDGVGAGLYCSDAAPTIENCIFEYNHAQMGGALFTSSCGMLVKNTIFRHNTAWNGGAAGVRGVEDNIGRTVFENCLFFNNKASYQGGAIYNFYYSDPLLMNCTLVDNIANSEEGSSSGYGGAIRNAIDSSFCRITNSIVYYNTEYSFITGTYLNSQLDETTAGSFTITYSDVMGASCDGVGCGTGCISLAPAFVNRAIWNYHLLNASPCIDVGTDTGAPQYDLDGVLRYDLSGIGIPGRVTDMGCYEAL
ncbi:MAG: choice-of-anchor Q domain-containing protein [Pseudomonadota bacterium]